MTVTVAAAAFCSEGAVIAADSMVFLPGFGEGWCLGNKLVAVPDAPWCGAYFTHWTTGTGPLPQTLDGAACAVWQRTRDACFDSPSSLSSARPQVMLAGTDGDGRVRLGYLTATATEWVSDRVVLSGLATCSEPGIWLEVPAAPTTLDEAVRVVCELVHHYIARWYWNDGMASLGAYLGAGVLPPVAEPVHVAIVEPGRVRMEERWAPA